MLTLLTDYDVKPLWEGTPLLRLKYTEWNTVSGLGITVACCAPPSLRRCHCRHWLHLPCLPLGSLLHRSKSSRLGAGAAKKSVRYRDDGTVVDSSSADGADFSGQEGRRASDAAGMDAADSDSAAGAGTGAEARASSSAASGAAAAAPGGLWGEAEAEAIQATAAAAAEAWGSRGGSRELGPLAEWQPQLAANFWGKLENMLGGQWTVGAMWAARVAYGEPIGWAVKHGAVCEGHWA